MGAATGLVVMDDKFTVEHQTEVNAYFAKSIQLSPESYLAVALDAGFWSYIANYSQLAPTDPSFSTDFRETRPNFGFSVIYIIPNSYVGVSVPQLNVLSLGNSSIENNAYFRNHYYFSGAFLAGKAEAEIRVKPAFLYTYTQGVPAIADVSAKLYLKTC